MIKGIGIDLIELDRIEKMLQRNERFLNRILTYKERERYSQLTSNKRKIEFVAGRFAAKEAFSKACGTGIGKLSFQDMEVLSQENGAPMITAKGFDHLNVHISITHSKTYAAAQVIVEE